MVWALACENRPTPATAIMAARQAILHYVVHLCLERPLLAMPTPHIIDESGAPVVDEHLLHFLEDNACSKRISATVLTNVIPPAQQLRNEAVAGQYRSKLTRVASPELIGFDPKYLPVARVKGRINECRGRQGTGRKRKDGGSAPRP